MSQLEDVIVAFVKETGRGRLRGKYFEVDDDEGRRKYAKWLAQELTDLEHFIEHNYDPGDTA